MRPKLKPCIPSNPSVIGAWVAPSARLAPGFYSMSRRIDGMFRDALVRCDLFTVIVPEVREKAEEGSGVFESPAMPSVKVHGVVNLYGYLYDADFLRAAEFVHGPVGWE